MSKIITFIVIAVIFLIAYFIGCWLGIIYTKNKETKPMIEDETPLVENNKLEDIDYNTGK
jgi:uncharacterized membrane protein